MRNKNNIRKFFYTQLDAKTDKIWCEFDNQPNLYNYYREAKDDLFKGNKIGKVKIELITEKNAIIGKCDECGVPVTAEGNQGPLFCMECVNN